MMELPSYKWPSPRTVLLRMAERGWMFVRCAGTLILLVSILVWAALYFPRDPNAAPHEQQRNSYLGRAGQVIEPAVKPLGWDWRIGCAVIASLPARELVVATLGVMYNVDDELAPHDRRWRDKLKKITWDGTDRPVYTLPVALGIMVFFALCAQCAATLAVIRRETNSWRWPLFTFSYMTVLAYVAGPDYLSSRLLAGGAERFWSWFAAVLCVPRWILKHSPREWPGLILSEGFEKIPVCVMRIGRRRPSYTLTSKSVNASGYPYRAADPRRSYFIHITCF